MTKYTYRGDEAGQHDPREFWGFTHLWYITLLDSTATSGTFQFCVLSRRISISPRKSNDIVMRHEQICQTAFVKPSQSLT